MDKIEPLDHLLSILSIATTAKVLEEVSAYLREVLSDNGGKPTDESEAVNDLTKKVHAILVDKL